MVRRRCPAVPPRKRRQPIPQYGAGLFSNLLRAVGKQMAKKVAQNAAKAIAKHATEAVAKRLAKKAAKKVAARAVTAAGTWAAQKALRRL